MTHSHDRIAPALPLAAEGWSEGDGRVRAIVKSALIRPSDTFSREREKGLHLVWRAHRVAMIAISALVFSGCASIVGDVRGAGYFHAIELVPDRYFHR